MPGAIITALALGLLPAEAPNRPDGPYSHVVVFRYHPALLNPSRHAREQDERQILKAIKDLDVGHRSEFSGGRGFEVSLLRKDLGRWKAAVDKLIKDGVLQYYRWGTDQYGYGLVPIRE